MYYLNKKEIKNEAKKILKRNMWNYWKAMLIVMAVSIGASMTVGVILGTESVAGRTVNTLMELALVPLSVGYIKYVLDIVRGKNFSIDNMFVFYKLILPIVAASILASVLVIIGCCLLIIPGIIATLALTMMAPIFADGEEDPIGVLKKSNEMMKGYKWDYFVFMLSFIGWFLLIFITCGIAIIWVLPYVSVSQMIYYDKLKKKPLKVRRKYRVLEVIGVILIMINVSILFSTLIPDNNIAIIEGAAKTTGSLLLAVIGGILLLIYLKENKRELSSETSIEKELEAIEEKKEEKPVKKRATKKTTTTRKTSTAKKSTTKKTTTKKAPAKKTTTKKTTKK